MTESPPRILIVDDNADNIEILGKMIENAGYYVYLAWNGGQALDTAHNVQPDLILLDIMMPGMDGFETCKKLRASDKTKDIPIIFITAKTDSSDVIEGFELGAVDYVTKPFNATELMARVNTHIALKLHREMVETVSREREELIHILCHDLSNPFCAFTSFINIIQNNYDAFEQNKDELLNHARMTAESGLELINLVRRMRSLDDDNVKLSKINLYHMIERSLYMLQDKIAAKNIRIDIHVDRSISVQVEMHSFINSVLNNIMTNALKFSHRGSEILITAKPLNGEILIRIKDRGVGMSQNILNSLFSTKKVISRKGLEGETGTGYGMLLMNKFVTAYGGRMEVESKDIKEFPDDHGTEMRLFIKSGAE